MSTTKQNGEHKHETFVDFDDEAYACFYDISRDKCYYDVNGELLLIIDPQKIKKIKSEYLKQRNLKYAGLAIAALFAGIAIFAITKYIKNSNDQYNGLVQEF